MNIDENKIKHIAKLSALHLTDDEAKKFASELKTITDFVDTLSSADTASVSDTASGGKPLADLRRDAPSQFDNADGIVSLAPEREFNFFKVKKVL